MRTEFYSESLKETDHSEDLAIYRRIILKCVLKKQGMRMWIGFR
jgi:hypothetical protein